MRRLQVRRAAALCARALCGFALTAMASLPAAAQDAGAARITGTWSLESEPYDSGCVMTGVLELARQGSEAPISGAIYMGPLTVVERCPWKRPVEAAQTCLSERVEDTLVIRCQIERLDPPDASYAPENFDLIIVHGALMTGELRSADIAPVRFTRYDAPIG